MTARRSDMLPDFLVIGAMKAGTTSLWSGLRDTPGVFVPMEKEPNVLGAPGYSEGSARSSYERLFAPSTIGDLKGECSTYYSKGEDVHLAPVRAFDLIGPEVRLVYCVREPIDRLISHYRHICAVGKTSGTLKAALDEDKSLIEAGRYSVHAEAWSKVFGRSSIRFVESSTLASDWPTAFKGVLEHVGLTGPVSVVSRPALNGADTYKPRVGSVAAQIVGSRFYQDRLRPRVPESARRLGLEIFRTAHRGTASLEGICLDRASAQQLIEVYDKDAEHLKKYFGFEPSWSTLSSFDRLRKLQLD